MRKTEKNLSDFNEQFLLKASSLTRTIKAVKQFLSPDNEHENKSMYMTEID